MINMICTLFAVSYLGGETHHFPKKYQEKALFTVEQNVIKMYEENTVFTYNKDKAIKMGKHINVYYSKDVTRRYYCKEIK